MKTCFFKFSTIATVVAVILMSATSKLDPIDAFTGQYWFQNDATQSRDTIHIQKFDQLLYLQIASTPPVEAIVRGDTIVAYSHESASIAEDGTAIVNLEGELKVYRQNEAFLLELVIPGLGSQIFTLNKIVE